MASKSWHGESSNSLNAWRIREKSAQWRHGGDAAAQQRDQLAAKMRRIAYHGRQPGGNGGCGVAAWRKAGVSENGWRKEMREISHQSKRNGAAKMARGVDGGRKLYGDDGGGGEMLREMKAIEII